MSDAAPTDVELLDEPPNLTSLYARAVRPGGGETDGTLPTGRVEQHGVAIDRDHVAAYARVCGFGLTDTLPLPYLHVLAFPLQIHLMSGRRFPFPLLGMVHVRQAIDVRRPIGADEPVDLAVWTEHLRAHGSGQQFTVRSTASVDDDVVWEGASTYLHRDGRTTDAPDEAHPADDVEVAALPTTATWRVPDDVGRAYGAVSGDRNPIHLSAITARPFGFPSAIAHGMWTLARAVSGLEGRLPARPSLDVSFRSPLRLPSAVEYATTRAGDDGWQFGVRGRDGRPHLAGVVTAR